MGKQQGELFSVEPDPWELDAEEDRLVAHVVFPEAPRGEFTYVIPDALRDRLQVGARVRVPLGRSNRLVTAYCVSIERSQGGAMRLKSLHDVLDHPSLITPEILRLARWITDRYLCDLGPTLEAVVPAGVRGQAGTRKTSFVWLDDSIRHLGQPLRLPPKQQAVVAALQGQSRPLSMAEVTDLAGCTTAPVNSLLKKGLLRSETRRVMVADVETTAMPRQSAWELNDDQRQALARIHQATDSAKYATILLHGITGSGKTEVYIQAIEQVIRFGRQAIVLVPEISLTPQTRSRFRERFQSVAVLHSHLSPSERHLQWQRIARGEAQVVVGARSAIFAPVPHLGLIVIDEEHEPSFKQDSVPRYHARDVAVQRATAAGVPLVLGSATPSLESWQRTITGEFELVSMPRRVFNRPLPNVTTIDLRDEAYRRGMRGAISRPLRQAMKGALAEGGQVILLLNRRGFSTHIQCPACGSSLRCENCDITMTHHRSGEKVVCHYCDAQMRTPDRCPKCSFEGIRFSGLGTQKLEAEVRACFPHAPSLRMDTDTMKGHGSHEAALTRFREGEIKILLGTQMIAKGLDFPNVTLVGVVNADVGLHLPDFRARERTFQLVTQVAGRTGRGESGGRVMVQTYSPLDTAIQAATHHDYAAFAAEELPMREAFMYPPFASLIRIVIRGPEADAALEFARHLGDEVRERIESKGVPFRQLGPVATPIPRLRGMYRFHLLIQGPHRDAMCEAIRVTMESIKSPDKVQWMIDADALSML